MAEGAVVTARELVAGRFHRLSRELELVAEYLDSDAPLSDDELGRLGRTIERLRLATMGLEQCRDGARREWVLSVLHALALLLAHFEADEAWSTWLGAQALEGEPDGPFPGVMSALLDEGNFAHVVAAARAVGGPARRGRRAAREASASTYAPVLALLERLPDGKGGTLGGMTDDALRKAVRRSRK